MYFEGLRPIFATARVDGSGGLNPFSGAVFGGYNLNSGPGESRILCISGIFVDAGYPLSKRIKIYTF
jgi:hypothetical protein